MPTAKQITVREVLGKFETDFAAVAQAVENGEFALWVGSGISRKAPNLGELIERAFDFIRIRAVEPPTTAAYTPALRELLALADLSLPAVETLLSQPLGEWPDRQTIIDKLWSKYSRVLDIPIVGQATDFILWEAVDIRQAFENPAPPSAEHLCIAVLVLEGAIADIASANWDGFIESAVERLSNGVPGIMQVIVEPTQLRGPAGRARLLKFHGCIIHAEREPTVFRRYLTGSQRQIMDWPESDTFRAMRNEIVGLATNQKTLVLGLSIQDNNLQALFARAKAVHAWPWPCAPNAPGHVFCEDMIQQGQRDILRNSYEDAYNQDPESIHAGTLLRAWGEQVLVALVLKLLTDKLAKLMEIGLGDIGKGAIANGLAPSLTALRDDIADLAVLDPLADSRTPFVNRAIGVWSRLLSVFRSGISPTSPDGYETLSTLTPNLIGADQNAKAMGLGRLAIALSLLQEGRVAGQWEIGPPASEDIVSGTLTIRAVRSGAVEQPLFVVRSAGEAIALKSNGAFVEENVIVVHADDAWHRTVSEGGSSRRVRNPPGRTGRAGETHVSLGDLLVRSNDAAALRQAFLEELIL